MAAKPFKVTSDASIGRNATGQFTKLVPSAPPQIVRGSVEQGVPLTDAIRANQVPDRDVLKGVPPVDVSGPGAAAPAPVYPSALPWGPAGPVNDANKLPFKVR